MHIPTLIFHTLLLACGAHAQRTFATRTTTTSSSSSSSAGRTFATVGTTSTTTAGGGRTFATAPTTARTTTTSTTGSSSTMLTTTRSSSSSSSSNAAAPTAFGSAYTPVAGASQAKLVFAHFMIGNCYPLTTVQAYVTQIQAAIAMGIDGFACNIGTEDWQMDRVSLMYAAAAQFSNFKVFISLDIAVNGNAPYAKFYPYVSNFFNSPAQYKIGGKAFLSTFGGESYSPEGQSPALSWLKFRNALAANGTDIYFLPGLLSNGAQSMGWNAVDGAFSWGGWLNTTDDDAYYLASRSNGNNQNIRYDTNAAVAQYTGKVYMASVSSLLYSGLSYKHWTFTQDNLYSVRWQNLIRQSPDFIEIISWNDYGESHYMGGFFGAYPYDGSGHIASTWTNGFDHTSFGPLTKFFVQWYKSGSRPGVGINQVYLQYRPHSLSATASNDDLGRPQCPIQGHACPIDAIYATVLLTGPTTVTITSGGRSASFQGQAGINDLVFNGLYEGTPAVTINGVTKSATGVVNNTITRYNYNMYMNALTF